MSPILSSKKREILDIAATYGAHNVRVFGSIASGKELSTSDIDLLVEMEPSRSILDQVALQQDLEALLGRRGDVVLIGGLSPYVEDRVLAEAVPL